MNRRRSNGIVGGTLGCVVAPFVAGYIFILVGAFVLGSARAVVSMVGASLIVVGLPVGLYYAGKYGGLIGAVSYCLLLMSLLLGTCSMLATR